MGFPSQEEMAMKHLGFSPSVKKELCHDVPSMYYLEVTRRTSGDVTEMANA